MYSYTIFKKSVVFSHSIQTDLLQKRYQTPIFESMKIPKTLISECARRIENKKILRDEIWAVPHGVVVEGGHWGHTITYVKAKTAKAALKFFNDKLANNHWTQKATIGNVEQIVIYKEV